MLEPLPPFQPLWNLLWLSQCQKLTHFGIDGVTYRNRKSKSTSFNYTGNLHPNLCLREDKLSLLSRYFATNDKTNDLII